MRIPYLTPDWDSSGGVGRGSAFSRVTALAAQRPVHAAFQWLHLHALQILKLQAELVTIPAPPFGEEQRSRWLAARFREAGLERIFPDAIGNVYASLPCESPAADNGHESVAEAARPVVVLSAHLDTVFPAGTPLIPHLDGERLEAPGACDNGAGVVGMLAIAHAMRHALMQLPLELVFLGNVGEEGEGDLRGVRQLYRDSPFAGRIAAHIVLDGAGTDTVVTQALGSRRYRVTVNGPGGHSFTDAGAPNPITALAGALARLAEMAPMATGAEQERTTWNVGTIAGGTSVNTIPESATAAVDFRSTNVEQLTRLEVLLHRAVEDAVDHANAARPHSEMLRGRAGLTFAIEKIGDRPAARLADDAPLLETLRAVDRHLGLRTDQRLGSTDANIPLSLGIQALSMGAGGEGGGAHTRAEWYSAINRELGLRRVLLLVLAMLDWAAQG